MNLNDIPSAVLTQTNINPKGLLDIEDKDKDILYCNYYTGEEILKKITFKIPGAKLLPFSNLKTLRKEVEIEFFINLVDLSNIKDFSSYVITNITCLNSKTNETEIINSFVKYYNSIIK